jgi:hypothetical protein
MYEMGASTVPAIFNRRIRIPYRSLSSFSHRPISKHGFAVDVALVDWAEVAAVVGHGQTISLIENGRVCG